MAHCLDPKMAPSWADYLVQRMAHCLDPKMAPSWADYLVQRKDHCLDPRMAPSWAHHLVQRKGDCLVHMMAPSWVLMIDLVQRKAHRTNMNMRPPCIGRTALHIQFRLVDYFQVCFSLL